MNQLMTGLVLVGLMALPACAHPTAPSAAPRAAATAKAKAATIQQVTVKEAAALLKAHPDYVLLDVRNPDEYAAGHAPGATLRPLPELASWAPKLDPKAHYVVICHSGRRSMMASNQLVERGFANITNVQGGMSEWAAQGLPVEP